MAPVGAVGLDAPDKIAIPTRALNYPTHMPYTILQHGITNSTARPRRRRRCTARRERTRWRYKRRLLAAVARDVVGVGAWDVRSKLTPRCGAAASASLVDGALGGEPDGRGAAAGVLLRSLFDVQLDGDDAKRTRRRSYGVDGKMPHRSRVRGQDLLWLGR